MKWFDYQELEHSLGSLPYLRRKIGLASDYKLLKEKIPKDLRLEIFIRRLILKKRVLQRRYNWTREELKLIFSEKIKLQTKLHEKEFLLSIAQNEIKIIKSELDSLRESN
ncbi:hypothetical protein HGB47_15200 [Leptospira yasudae]|uniref:LIC_10907 family protein n=1 Tax=Leptospira yasudae TaxID=2202201 RepID=UPI001C4FB3B6|nr:hypothetical protein [Leptospira yasudae]MBW0434964.1 hypothetical protein [Leptospira yasudae]